MLSDDLLTPIIRRLNEGAKENTEMQRDIFDFISPQELGYLLRVMNANGDAPISFNDLENIILSLSDK